MAKKRSETKASLSYTNVLCQGISKASLIIMTQMCNCNPTKQTKSYTLSRDCSELFVSK